MPQFNSDRNNPIVGHLDAVKNATGYRQKRVFGDWVNTMADSFALDDEAYNQRVAEYETEYPNETKAIFEHYQKAYVALFKVSRDTELDIIGEVYEQLGATSDSFGQFFTPNEVANMMAKMVGVAGASEREATIDHPYVVKDPACGSGRFLVHQAYHTLEAQPNEPTIFVGQDIDRLCARMTAVNFAVHGITGYAIEGDSLNTKPQAVWWIQHTQPKNGIIEEIDSNEISPTNQDSTGETADSTDINESTGSGESERPGSKKVTLDDFT